MVFMRDITLWAINMGKNAEAEALFLGKNLVSPGWDRIPDLSYVGDREAVKTRYQQSYPDTNPSELTRMAAQVFRFVQEIGEGDFIVFPARQTRRIHIGQVTSNYTFRPSVHAAFPHQRSVRWLKEFSRAQFSQGALFELGSALKVFKVKAHADEFRAALERKLATPDEKILPSASVVTDEIEEQTRDFVSQRLGGLSRQNFEQLVGNLLRKMGYRTARVANGFVDLIANKGLLGIEPPTVKVHLTSSGRFGESELAAFTKEIAGAEQGLVFSPGTFAPSLWNCARAQGRVQLIDGAALADLVFALYEDLDLTQRQILPLKKVFVPDLSGLEESN
jgi:restriction system protein